MWPSERASRDALQWQQREFEITGNWEKGSFWPSLEGFGQPWQSPQLAAGGGKVGVSCPLPVPGAASPAGKPVGFSWPKPEL